ncbi:anti-sigma factor family protein [Metabacillus iocasae]|uniref:Anti-sigma-W factor RsiW n=1 Tax=Priestia iocasae TaxID=2291674 RepID=A0ABS2R017_9BACI|nr:anti-sigma factor [Metabacillus iocasae]MBM7705002.1 anti-sigma factor RsiW [Metabacillus iocasae]
MNCSNEYVNLIHEYLDGDINKENEEKLKAHLSTCVNCQQRLKELKKTIAFVQSTSHIELPLNFTETVMGALPKEKSSVRMNRWFRGHPFLTAAAVFFILMFGSVTSSWTNNDEFSVSKQSNLVVNDDVVIIPEGEIVRGDVTVRNGVVRVEGTVEGDLTVINGERYMASAGEVTGDIQELDQLFEWVWYKIKSNVKDALNIVDTKE